MLLRVILLLPNAKPLNQSTLRVFWSLWWGRAHPASRPRLGEQETCGYRAAPPLATVIAAVVDPLTDDNVNVGETLELIRHTGKPSGGTEFHLVITEAHKDSFDGGQLDLKFSGLPEDVTVTDLDAWVTTKKDFDDADTKTALVEESSTHQYGFESTDVKGGARCGRRRRGDRAPTDGA